MLVAFPIVVMTTVPTEEPLVRVMVMLELHGAVKPVLFAGIVIEVPDTRLLTLPAGSIRVVVFDAGYGTVALELLTAEGNVPVPDGTGGGLSSLIETSVPLGHIVELAGNHGAAVTAMLVRMMEPVPEMTRVEVGRMTVMTGREVQFPVGLLEVVPFTWPTTVEELTGRAPETRELIDTLVGTPVPSVVWLPVTRAPDCVLFHPTVACRVCERVVNRTVSLPLRVTTEGTTMNELADSEMPAEEVPNEDELGG